VTTVPAGILAERQKFLLSRMTHADRILAHPARYHLVGHSAGGVEAELLRAESPLKETAWTDIDPDGVRARIATITISSPHYGTYLADSGVVACSAIPSII
jgi:alpha-beta hydrolase superfamily lysophospholipase